MEEEKDKKTSKKEAIKNWMSLEVPQELAEALAANNFVKPTQVQAQSLVYLNSHVDMVIAAKTGQGKTLTFAIPILDLLIKKLMKDPEEEFKSVKALIMSPTRELALQIKDHIAAVVPIQYQQKIKICPIVGGMSVQKQERLLSYEPTIIIATPGRLWELVNERMNKYLVNELPMIDVLVLDEADRMIEDGHFNELKLLLDFVYTKRVEYKKQNIHNNKMKRQDKEEDDEEVREIKKGILSGKGKQNQFVMKEIEKSKTSKIDMSQIVDMYDEDEMLQEIRPDELVIENLKEQTEEEKKEKKKNKKRVTKEQMTQEQEEKFNQEYKKMGGIQHIICSATLSIDSQGRVTPKQQKKLKKQGAERKEAVDTLALLCKTLRFRSKNPKVIDLTEEDRIPETLIERGVKCKKEEKDLYTYYYVQQNKNQPMIIFCNSITCVKRLTSLLSFLKIRNTCLHSKMQQRQRLKNLDRFKRAVQEFESGNLHDDAILVCTDVAARGLDIPYVQHVVHYQCPFNAEIYIHRSGRTARIGRQGESLAILGPEDEKNFRQIRKVLKKPDDDFQMYPISYVLLSKLEAIVQTAQKFESEMHKQIKEKKSANWVLKAAKDADLLLDDNLQHELQETLGMGHIDGKKKKKEVLAPIDVYDEDQLKVRDDEDEGVRRKTKEQSKVQQLKAKYDKLKKEENLKKFSNSSFLTPEAASYLNELIKKKQTQVDQEIVFAGQHSEAVAPKKFKRTQKYSARYKNRTKKRRKH